MHRQRIAFAVLPEANSPVGLRWRCLRQGRSSDLSHLKVLQAFPPVQGSGINAEYRELQQRVLSRIRTGFPFHSLPVCRDS